MKSRTNQSHHDQCSSKEHLDKLAKEINKLSPKEVEKLEKMVQLTNKRVLSLKEAASIFDVSLHTLRRAIRVGTLKAFQINKAGNWKVPVEEVERFMRGDSHT